METSSLRNKKAKVESFPWKQDANNTENATWSSLKLKDSNVYIRPKIFGFQKK